MTSNAIRALFLKVFKRRDPRDAVAVGTKLLAEFSGLFYMRCAGIRHAVPVERLLKEQAYKVHYHG